jgi:hypothetical protein
MDSLLGDWARACIWIVSYHKKEIQTQLHLKKQQQQNNRGGENIMHQSTTLAHNFSCRETINNKQNQQQTPAQKPQHDTAARVRAMSPGESGQGIWGVTVDHVGQW